MSTEGNTSNPNSEDPAWKYFHLKDPNKKGCLTCNFCEKTTNGGVYRAKWHIVGGNRNVTSCKKSPGDVKKEVMAYMQLKKQQAEKANELSIDQEFEEYDDDGEETPPPTNDKGKRPASESISASSVMSNMKKSKVKGPMDLFMKVKPVAKSDHKRQTTLNESVKKELRDRACHKLARWMYDAGMSFNAVNYPSFEEAIHAVGEYGPNMKKLSYHEIRVKYLKREVTNTTNMMKDHKEAWERFGCSVMCDGWKDRCGRHLINFLVNCPLGSLFIESIDASSFKEDGLEMCELLTKFIDKHVGAQNVIQIVTDNASAMKYAGRLLEGAYPNLYWTPCAAHCLDLMLEDFGKLPRVKSCVSKAIEMTSFLYKSARLLDMMKDFTGKRNLLRPGKTRFCTVFITLSSIQKQKAGLRQMFTSEKWRASPWYKEAMGKKVFSTVLSNSFWRNVTYSLKMAAPVVKVLRLVDGERKPAMGYIFEAMERAKEAVAKAFINDQDQYEEISVIIDKRWSDQLHKPLHAAGHYLNPDIFYQNRDAIERDVELNTGLIDCITRLTPGIALQDQIITELPKYKEAMGLFGRDVAKRHRSTKSPAEWWSTYGSGAPNLQQFAIKVLSLTCSSSGCERNWSSFEHSFFLDKWSGKKCYMMSSRSLFIVWSDTPEYWEWNSLPESRFAQVAELGNVCWLEIRGKINLRMLSPATKYAVYLVYNLTVNARGFARQNVEGAVETLGVGKMIRTAYLDPNVTSSGRWIPPTYGSQISSTSDSDQTRSKRRDDGWLEIELGEYFNEGGMDQNLDMSLEEVKSHQWKSGLVIEGFEIRPKA